MIKKLISYLTFPFLLINGILLFTRNSERFNDIDFSFLMGSNIFFLLLTGIIMYFVSKSAQSKNPNVFVRSIMGGMLAKMMITALVFIIALPWVKKLGSAEILSCMLIYMTYLMLEVVFLSKSQKKSNA